MDACAGSVSGVGVTAVGKRNPSFASASISGVAFRPATKPTASGRSVSIVTRSTFGRDDDEPQASAQRSSGTARSGRGEAMLRRRSRRVAAGRTATFRGAFAFTGCAGYPDAAAWPIPRAAKTPRGR